MLRPTGKNEKPPNHRSAKAGIGQNGVLTELEIDAFVSRRVRDLTNGSQQFVSFRPPIPDFILFAVVSQ